jgi:hypothetical protein
MMDDELEAGYISPSPQPLGGFSTYPAMHFASLNPMGFTSFNLPPREREKY